MAQIHCFPEGRSFPIAPDQTVLESILAAGITHTHVCGGQAYCSTCRIMILDGIRNCSSPSPAENALANKLQFPVHVRLACQTKVTGDVQVRRMVIDSDDLDIVDSQLLSGASTKEKNLTVLLASIRGATNFDEVNFPVDVIYVMGKYFQRSRRIVETYGGKIDNYMANWWMATYDSETTDRTTERAVWTALEILKAVDELNLFLKQLNYSPLQVRMAAHMGSAVMVPVDQNRPNFLTPLGDVISQVSRIENANRSFNAGLLVSGKVRQELGNNAVVGKAGSIEISKGEEILVFEITGINGEAPAPMVKSEEKPPITDRIFAFMQKFGFGKGQKV